MVGGSSGPRPGRAPDHRRGPHPERAPAGVTGDDHLVARTRIVRRELEPADRDARRAPSRWPGRCRWTAGRGPSNAALRRVVTTSNPVPPPSTCALVSTTPDRRTAPVPHSGSHSSDRTSTVASAATRSAADWPLLVIDAPSTATWADDLGATSTAKIRPIDTPITAIEVSTRVHCSSCFPAASPAQSPFPTSCTSRHLSCHFVPHAGRRTPR